MKVQVICSNCESVHTYGDLDSPVEVAAHVVLCGNCTPCALMLNGPAVTTIDTEGALRAEIATLRRKLADAADFALSAITEIPCMWCVHEYQESDPDPCDSCFEDFVNFEQLPTDGGGEEPTQ